MIVAHQGRPVVTWIASRRRSTRPTGVLPHKPSALRSPIWVTASNFGSDRSGMEASTRTEEEGADVDAAVSATLVTASVAGVGGGVGTVVVLVGTADACEVGTGVAGGGAVSTTSFLEDQK